MKSKVYKMFGKAIDSNGLEHIVTIVGEFTKSKDETLVSKECQVNGIDGCVAFIPLKNTIRTLRYAISICHTDDLSNYDENLGVKLAKKRLKTRPLGELTTKFKTSLCDDQIKLILFGELKHVMDNIDKFIR